MAIAVRAVGAVGTGLGAVTPGLPAGTDVDDILVMFVQTMNQAITVSGWTEAGSSPQSEAGAATRLTVFWKRATGGSDATTTSDSGDHQLARIIGFTGCVTSGDPFDVTAGGSQATPGTALTVPGATTTVANTMVLAAAAVSSDESNTAFFSGWTNANLTNLTERCDNVTLTGAGGGIGVATGEWASIGAYGDTTATMATSNAHAMWSGALKPYVASSGSLIISSRPRPRPIAIFQR